MYKKEIVQAIIVTSLLIVIFILAIIAFFLQYRNKKIQNIKDTKLLNEEHNAQLLSTQLEIQTQTMQHIGREIHDNVGQKLTLASLYTQQLSYENKAPQINEKIVSISKIINDSLAELRQLSKSLTDDNINEKNIIELLQLECENVNNLKSAQIKFQTNNNNINLAYQTKSILLRIVQEFIQNSLKHSKCKNISITFFESEKSLKISLQDDGIGFNIQAKNKNGIGLENFKKRIDMLNGIFQLESKIGSGTSLKIEIPQKND